MKRAALLGLVVSLSCGGGQTRRSAFAPAWPDASGEEARALVATLDGHAKRDADVAVATATSKNEIFGVDLRKKKRWSFEHAVEGRPVIAGGVVVLAGGGELVALDAHTGKHLWTRPTWGRLRGAGDDGDVTLVSLEPPTGKGTTLLAVRRDGRVTRQLEEDEVIGAPGVIRGFAFLPWHGDRISVLDLYTNAERTRLTVPSATDHVFATAGSLFFAGAQLTRLRALPLAPMTPPKPLGDALTGVHFSLATSILDPDEGHAASNDKARLYVRATAPGRWAATFHRLALGIDDRGALGWVYTNQPDFLGGAVFRGGFALCDERGTVTFLDLLTGARAGEIKLVDQGSIASCVVRTEDFSPGPSEQRTALSEQIDVALAVTDPKLAPVQDALRAIKRGATIADRAEAR